MDNIERLIACGYKREAAVEINSWFSSDPENFENFIWLLEERLKKE